MSRWFIFGQWQRPILPFRVNLLYWKPKKGDNVGDLLSLIVFNYIRKKSRIVIKPRRLVMIGSVLSFVGGGKTTVWGTGLMNESCVQALLNPFKKVKLDIRAVRGPKTRDILLKSGFKCPKVYGDPAILMPLYYKPSIAQIKGKVVIIPHHSRLEKYKGLYDNVLDTYTDDWQGFINQILSAEKVISSSLHGIILAESYGIPCVMLNDIPDSRFKYDDYYLSTGRQDWPLASSIKEALFMDGKVNLKVKEMQDTLLKAFPYDIFY